MYAALARAIARADGWLPTTDHPERYWGPGAFDFEPDWKATVARGWLKRLLRRGK